MSEDINQPGAKPAPQVLPETEARFHRFRVGALECISLSDGSIRVPLPPSAPAEQASTAAPPQFRFVPLSCLLVRMPSSGKLVLMDSGFGFDPERVGRPMRTDGRLMESLAGAGIAPEQIDFVLISHLDPDHVGGLFTASGAKVFSNAEYYAPAEAMEYWSKEEIDLSGSPCPTPIKQERVNASKRLVAIAGSSIKTFRIGEEAVPGIGTMALPGHAPGQAGFILSSEGETLIYTADAIVHAVISIETPDAHNIMDLDPHLGSQTRRKLVEMISEAGWHSFSPHVQWPHFGKVHKTADSFTWKPGS